MSVTNVYVGNSHIHPPNHQMHRSIRSLFNARKILLLTFYCYNLATNFPAQVQPVKTGGIAILQDLVSPLAGLVFWADPSGRLCKNLCIDKVQ